VQQKFPAWPKISEVTFILDSKTITDCCLIIGSLNFKAVKFEVIFYVSWGVSHNGPMHPGFKAASFGQLGGAFHPQLLGYQCNAATELRGSPKRAPVGVQSATPFIRDVAQFMCDEACLASTASSRRRALCVRRLQFTHRSSVKLLPDMAAARLTYSHLVVKLWKSSTLRFCN